MIRFDADLTRFLPIDREKATQLVLAAGKFQATLTLEAGSTVLNLKSMIGLLSQSIPKDGKMCMIAEGEDEREAAEAMAKLIGV